MCFEKLETLLRVALDMRGNAEGLSLADIGPDYGVSRRTAERMRDAIERAFPQVEQANPISPILSFCKLVGRISAA